MFETKQQTLIIEPTQISFSFNAENMAYWTQLNIFNKSNDLIYFKIVSTFGNLLSSIPQKRQLQPLSKLNLKLKMKIPNQFSKNKESLFIYFSIYQTVQNSLPPFYGKIEVKIQFDQNVPDEDEVIETILKQDCKQLCEQARQLLKQGQIKKALYKFQQSFVIFKLAQLLYRHEQNGLYGMAECFYLLQQWGKALQSIETVVLLHSDNKIQWLKLKIVFQLLKNRPKQIKFIRQLKSELLKLKDIAEINERKQQMLRQLKEIEQKIMNQKGGQFIYTLIEKTLDNYQTDEMLKQIYQDKKLLQKQLNQVLQIKITHNIEQTPQYILDPITYQIMRQPMIGPSGHSFEKKSLIQYLKRHNNKDLFTRNELRYEWTRPNEALRRFIQQNPQKHKWEQYEKQLTSFK